MNQIICSCNRLPTNKICTTGTLASLFFVKLIAIDIGFAIDIIDVIENIISLKILKNSCFASLVKNCLYRLLRWKYRESLSEDNNRDF